MRHIKAPPPQRKGSQSHVPEGVLLRRIGTWILFDCFFVRGLKEFKSCQITWIGPEHINIYFLNKKPLRRIFARAMPRNDKLTQCRGLTLPSRTVREGLNSLLATLDKSLILWNKKFVRGGDISPDLWPLVTLHTSVPWWTTFSVKKRKHDVLKQLTYGVL